uniref:Calcineurin-like phosphoesterase domain-containing protein n=1 Tax=Dunaliella tertiolecta TaxID=3047 RepID=A0A7S3QLC8_DUNTE|eukprot:CAMPEP_0202337304 /NCGR_PEP_ID=MMETSP1126-20121109/34_1 /ASSEMBLY_ACC=CAM_ASM_000457 /TAXON_ID=3047 /ORGANISM="Dunaliella tertiolecta, Strain CCMP1320" /LENGTH=409 /DNA_ID=CAMNT_0048927457 /DNA_START=21 /DNA_END=1250 /DNA_ORIENTATION=-
MRHVPDARMATFHDECYATATRLEQLLRRLPAAVGVLLVVMCGAGMVAMAAMLLLALGQASEALESRTLSHEGPLCSPGFSAADQDLTFFVVGDWGRGGTANQRLVAALMGQQSTCYRPSFVLSTGDNFYPHGLRAHDPYFVKTFTDVYTAQGLQVPWYCVLGNHDYGEFGSLRGGCMAPEFSLCPPNCCYSASWQDSLTIPSITGRESVAAMDPRWNLKQGAWRKSFAAGNLVDVVFTDTTPFMRRYRHKAWGNMSGGVLRQDVYKQFVEIQDLMRSSSATWKLVVGHHPIRSYGEHCQLGGDEDCLDMQFLKPVLQKFKADVYMSGHDHGIQLLKDPGSDVHFLVSGAGSNTKRGRFKNVNGNDILFLSDQPGFVAISIKGNKLRLDTFSIHSPNPTYTMSIDKEMP